MPATLVLPWTTGLAKRARTSNWPCTLSSWAWVSAKRSVICWKRTRMGSQWASVCTCNGFITARFFDVEKMRAHLLAGRAVNALVGHCDLPVGQVEVLGGQTFKPFAGQRVLLNVFDPGFDLAFVARHRRFGRQDHRAI